MLSTRNECVDLRVNYKMIKLNGIASILLLINLSFCDFSYYLPANQHLFSPKRGRNTESCKCDGKLSKIAAMLVITNGTPQAYIL